MKMTISSTQQTLRIKNENWFRITLNQSKIQNEMYNIHYSLYLNNIKGFDIEWEDE